MKRESKASMLIAFTADDEGVTTIEYALLGALVAIAILAGVTALGTNLEALYNNVATIVASAMP